MSSYTNTEASKKPSASSKEAAQMEETAKLQGVSEYKRPEYDVDKYPEGQSKYSFIKQGWGDRPNFQYSYGLNMYDDESIQEGNRIIEMFRQDEHEDGNQQRGFAPIKPEKN